MGVRIWCDPIVYYNLAQNLCNEFRKVEPDAEVRLILHSKRSTHEKFETIIKADKFCSNPPLMTWWGSVE